MRPDSIIVLSPMLQANKPISVQAFVSQPAVEAFGVGILYRLSRTDEIEFYALSVRPFIQDAPGEFRSGIDGDGFRQPPRF
jgi:hypothetical protein